MSDYLTELASSTQFEGQIMIQIEPIQAFTDNYIWCLYDDSSKQAIVVDPGDAAPVRMALAEHDLQLAGIFITHHHFDHTGGLDDLLRDKSIPVYGPYNDAIPQITNRVKEGDTVEALGTSFNIYEVPGHTLDHIAYYSSNAKVSTPSLFCGDTLFAGGCGRVFEGNPTMMLDSLTKLAQLPPNTEVFCAHEYTLGNLTFAMAVEPGNESLKARVESDKKRRSKNIPTVPSTLQSELDTNPFLRCQQPSVIKQAEQHEGKPCQDNVAVFAAIRGWKDNF